MIYRNEWLSIESSCMAFTEVVAAYSAECENTPDFVKVRRNVKLGRDREQRHMVRQLKADRLVAGRIESKATRACKYIRKDGLAVKQLQKQGMPGPAAVKYLAVILDDKPEPVDCYLLADETAWYIEAAQLDV